uniref:Uncharacterized protein n=1 Tax=Oryza punctata TaxID=4537 RepID=A0A0E0JDZ6_ORYPU
MDHTLQIDSEANIELGEEKKKRKGDSKSQMEELKSTISDSKRCRVRKKKSTKTFVEEQIEIENLGKNKDQEEQKMKRNKKTTIEVFFQTSKPKLCLRSKSDSNSVEHKIINKRAERGEIELAPPAQLRLCITQHERPSSPPA